MRLGGPQTPGSYGEKKHVWLLPRIEPRFLGHTACGLVTLLTELHRVVFRHTDITSYHPEPQYLRDRKPEYKVCLKSSVNGPISQRQRGPDTRKCTWLSEIRREVPRSVEYT